MKSIILFYFILFIFLPGRINCQDDFANEFANLKLSLNNIQYIYNRVFDLALRDNRSGFDLRSIFVAPIKQFDKILVTIEPQLSKKAFNTTYIDSLNWIYFRDSLNIQDQFNQIQISNTFNIQYQHFDKPPILDGNHFIHATFSDIYFHDGFYYVGVLLEHKIQEGTGVNYPDWVLFKLEWCHEKYILFKKIYNPLGTDGYTNKCYTRDLEDRKCY